MKLHLVREIFNALIIGDGVLGNVVVNSFYYAMKPAVYKTTNYTVYFMRYTVTNIHSGNDNINSNKMEFSNR